MDATPHTGSPMPPEEAADELLDAFARSTHPTLARAREARQSGTLLLGIDPGHADGTATVGLCLYDPRARCDRAEAEGGAFRLRTLPLLDALAFVAEAAPSVAVAVLEDSRSLPVFARHDRVKGRARDRLARNVGRVDGAVSLLVAHLARLGVPVALRSPQGRRKLDAEAFRALTRYPAEAAAETTQHERDAAFLVYGYTAGQLLREAERQAAERTPATGTPCTEGNPMHASGEAGEAAGGVAP